MTAREITGVTRKSESPVTTVVLRRGMPISPALPVPIAFFRVVRSSSGAGRRSGDAGHTGNIRDPASVHRTKFLPVFVWPATMHILHSSKFLPSRFFQNPSSSHHFFPVPAPVPGRERPLIAAKINSSGCRPSRSHGAGESLG